MDSSPGSFARPTGRATGSEDSFRPPAPRALPSGHQQALPNETTGPAESSSAAVSGCVTGECHGLAPGPLAPGKAEARGLGLALLTADTVKLGFFWGWGGGALD